MAKAKSNSKKITLEESLVPVEEQPYEVPENWCWTKLGVVSKFERGITFPASAKESEQTEENIPCLRTANIQENLELGDLIYVNRSYMKHNDNKLVMKDDIIMSSANSRELVGKVSYVHNVLFPMTFGGFVLGIRAKEINSKYLFYHLRYEFLCGKFIGESTQTTNIANINTTTLGNHFFPLPPLVEQKRIVKQIESLFAKLDEAKEKALSVVESFELRKKAIYKKAFEGDLTNIWRAENGINISEWEEIPFEKLGKLERGRSKHRPRNDKRLFGGKYPFIQTGDVAGAGMYVTSHKQTLSEFGFEQSRMFPKGTLCITIAANIGDAAILSYDCCFPDSVVGFTPGEKCLNKYMYFYLQEIKAELEYIAPATAQKNLNLKLLGKVEIKVPSLKEQEKIVEILEKQINDQENIVEKAENVIETIDVMKKSILAKAFRGELGTNIETEESAIELLKSIF